jgi:hypothetical protein
MTAIIADTGDAVIAVDLTGVITSWNPNPEDWTKLARAIWDFWLEQNIRG